MPLAREEILEYKLAHIFPVKAMQDEARRMLNEYGSLPDEHREVIRVRLAALKLAGDDLLLLRRQIEEAKIDFRDVLSPAEYPRQLRFGSCTPDNIAADLKDYESWLREGLPPSATPEAAERPKRERPAESDDPAGRD